MKEKKTVESHYVFKKSKEPIILVWTYIIHIDVVRFRSLSLIRVKSIKKTVYTLLRDWAAATDCDETLNVAAVAEADVIEDPLITLIPILSGI